MPTLMTGFCVLPSPISDIVSVVISVIGMMGQMSDSPTYFYRDEIREGWGKLREAESNQQIHTTVPFLGGKVERCACD